jgi:hypothetical protein
MSAHDAGYLERETAAQPLHFVFQLDLGGSVTVEDLRALVTSRAGALPFLARMPRTPLLAGRPVWVDDPHFAVERQVVAWPTPLEDRDQVDAAFEAMTRERLPRDRPLWKLVVAQGPQNTTTLLLACHHAMLDGSLLSAVLDGLFRASGELPPVVPRRGPGRAWLLGAVVARRLRALLPARTGPSAAAPGAQAAPLSTSLTGPVSPERRLCAASVDLGVVKERRRRLGASVNDLFLLAVTDALSSYLEPLPQHVVALVPRDVRAEDEAHQVGNRGWSMLVPLPVAEQDRAERLRLISEATAKGKNAPTTSGTQGWRFDIALSNVRLGDVLSVLGVPAVRHRCSVPLQGTNRLVVVATSLGNELALSITADGAVYADAERLLELTVDAMVGAHDDGRAGA